jgi:hypothetical protein
MFYGIKKLLSEIKEWLYSFWDSCPKADFLRKFLKHFWINYTINLIHLRGSNWESVDPDIRKHLFG